MVFDLSPIKKKGILILGIGFLFFLHLRMVYSENTYALDSFVKLVQTVSIQKNNFQSEELVYLAKSYDKESTLLPIPTFTMHVKEKYLSPFSVDFAALNAVLLHWIDKRNLPYVCLAFSILTLIVFAFTKDVSFKTFLLAGLGTPLLYQGLEYSENSLLLLLQSIAFFFYFKDKTNADRFLTGFFLTLGIFFRLESIVFVFLLLLIQWIVSHKLNLKNFFRAEMYFLIGLLLPVILFITQNLILYDHVMGARFLSNRSTLSAIPIIDRLVQAKNLIFLTYLKIGFFGFTPIFLWSMGYLLKNRNQIADNKDKVLLFTLLLFIPIIALIAPNDGVTNWGARYLNLAILPSLFLFHSFENQSNFASRKKLSIAFYVFAGYSLVILLLGLKFQQIATKEIRLFQEDIQKQEHTLHILGAETIALYSGIHYFEHPMVLPKDASSLETFLFQNQSLLTSGNTILLSRIKPNPTVAEGIKVGLFPQESHYETLLMILRKHFKMEKTVEGKKLNFHLLWNP